MFRVSQIPKAIESKTVSKTLVSFYTSTIIDFLKSQTNLSSTTMNHLLPTILQGLKNLATFDFQLSTYMIVAQICAQQTLSNELLDTLLFDIIKFAQYSHYKEAFMCILAICQSQRPQTFSEGFFIALTKIR